MPTLSFDRVAKVMTVPISDTSITVQEVYDQVRDYEDEPGNMDLNVMVSGSGKDDLGGGEFTITVVKLLDDWRLAFAARIGPTTVSCLVTDGVFLASNSFSDNPIFPTTFTQVQIRQAVAGTITEVNQPDIALMKKIMQNRKESDPVTGILTIYDDDDTTILLQANIFKDVLAVTPYEGTGLERQDRLQ